MRRWRRVILRKRQGRGMERQVKERQDGREKQGKLGQGQMGRSTEKGSVLRAVGGKVETVAEIYYEGKKPVCIICKDVLQE